MGRFCFALTLLVLASTAGAEEAADPPILVLETGGHTGPVRRILFTPDGKQVVTVSHDKTVRLWDAATGEGLGVLRPPIAASGEGSSLDAAAVSRDGKTLAVAGVGLKLGKETVYRVFLIDLANGNVKSTLQGHDGDVTCLAFSHDGKLAAAGCMNHLAYIWDLASGQLLHTLEGHKEHITDLAFSPNDRLLATASADQTARLWSVEGGKETTKPLLHDYRPLRSASTRGVYSVAWKDDDVLATAGGGVIFINLWDRTGKRLQHFDKLRSSPGVIANLAFVPGQNNEELFYLFRERENLDGKSIKYGSAVLNIAKPEASRDGLTWDQDKGAICGAVSPDGTLAATAGEDDDGVVLWTLRDGKPVRVLKGRVQTHHRVGWSPQGRVIGWTDDLKRPVDGPDILQHSFALDELSFGRQPDVGYLRTSPPLGGFHLRKNGANFLVVRDKGEKEIVSAIKDATHCGYWTWLPGEQVVLALEGRLALYNARTGERIRDLGSCPTRPWDSALSPDGRYLLASCLDHTMRIWDMENKDPATPGPLLSLFVAGADWIAWTREGYYAASPAGEKLMGWQVNNGTDKLATFYPAAQFHKTFYRPDIIKRVLIEGSVEKARAAADKESGVATKVVEVANALPPNVKIVAPTKDDPKTADVNIKAESQSKDRPIVSMRLLLDGRPYPGAEVKKFAAAKPGAKQEATWTVKKPEGEHVLTVLAESDASYAVSPTVPIAYQAAVADRYPTLYLVTIGINAYPGTLKLNWAVDDASAIAKTFKTEGTPKPFGKVEVKLLLDKDATKEGILAALDSLKTMTSDDTAVIFYAGHGHRDKKSGQFYILPVDVDPANLDKTGVTGTEIKKRLQAAPGRVLVLLDACHSGSIGQSPADPGSLTDDVQRQLAAPDCGAVIMCAAMAQEEAGEAASVKHGFFTAALLSGLGGKAPHSKDGLIHLTSLNYYVEEAVAELSKDEQHVVVDRPSTVTSFPLVKPGADSTEKQPVRRRLERPH